jgi:pSer/pThr/pTyr-binding forkhead associated (FHA) protein
MGKFKNTIINCQNCQKLVMVKVVDWEKGEIICSHIGCNFKNKLNTNFHFNEDITKYLTEFGHLVAIDKPQRKYPLKMGKNIIGVSNECDLKLERNLHNNKCYISRKHATIEVIFDKWSGLLRYRVYDGVFDGLTNEQKNSMNGTIVNNIQLKTKEIVDIPVNGKISFGGIDVFELVPSIIPKQMLNTYKTSLIFDEDSTQ